MADTAEYTDFWVACAAAGPVLLIPTYLMVRQQLAPGSTVRTGLNVASVALLAAGTIFALVQLAGGTPVHGARAGRVLELILICAPVIVLVVSLLRRPSGENPKMDALGMPEVRQ
jgi:hypothetical protein